MNIIPKVAMGVVGAGGIVGGSFLILKKQQSKDNKSNLASKLEEEGFILIGKNDSQWRATLEKYNIIKEKSEEAFTISTNNLTVEQLKEKCESLLGSESYSEIEKNKASRWCTIPISVKSRIEKLGRRVLSDVEGNQDDKGVWTTLVKNHLSEGSENKLTVNINALNNEEVDDARINEMKKGCKALSNKNSLDKDYLSDYSKFHNWCSIPK